VVVSGLFAPFSWDEGSEEVETITEFFMDESWKNMFLKIDLPAFILRENLN
jgi:hypothetical protein